MQKQNPKLPAFIEQLLKELRAAKKRSQALRAYHWKRYSELAYQRRQIEDQLLRALNEQAASSKTSKLTPQEIALTSPQSQTIVSVSGEIERVFDLRPLGNTCAVRSTILGHLELNRW